MRQPVPFAEADFAIALHKIAVSNLPSKTPVDTIPHKFAALYPQVAFPIPADRIPPGPDGLASILSGSFVHILNFTQNREGRVFVTPVFAADTTNEQIVDVHRKNRASGLGGPEMSSKIPQAKNDVAVKNVAADNTNVRKIISKNVSSPEKPSKSPPAARDLLVIPPAVLTEYPEALALLAKAVHELLRMKPEIGEGANLDELRKNISECFFTWFHVPMTVAGGTIPIDPLSLMEKFQGTLFTRVMEEPVTGSVFVKAIVALPPLPPVIPPPQAKPVPAKPLALPAEVEVAALRLRAHLEKSLVVLDSALSGKRSFDIPDTNLWKNALDTLLSQESQALEVLSNLFPS